MTAVSFLLASPLGLHTLFRCRFVMGTLSTRLMPMASATATLKVLMPLERASALLPCIK